MIGLIEDFGISIQNSNDLLKTFLIWSSTFFFCITFNSNFCTSSEYWSIYDDEISTERTNRIFTVLFRCEKSMLQWVIKTKRKTCTQLITMKGIHFQDDSPSTFSHNHHCFLFFSYLSQFVWMLQLTASHAMCSIGWWV